MIHTTHQKKILIISWLLTSISIPILSIFGRPLLEWVYTQFRTDQLALLLGITLFLLFFAIISYMVKTQEKKPRWLIVGLAVIFLVIQWQLSVVEERMHVILFGMFGFLSVRLFPLAIGIFICGAMSASDELLQFYLADRFGEWHDVFLNLMSTGLGAALAIYVQIGAKSNRVSNSNPGDSYE